MVKYKTSTQSISAENENKTIILQLDAGEYFGLNEVGSSIWRLIQERPSTIAELKKHVLESFEIDVETCERDIEKLIAELTIANLIETEAS